MLELSLSKKNRINLSDYDYEKDIKNRILMANFTSFQIEVLQEILYGSLKIPLTRLIDNLETDQESLFQALEALRETDLFYLEDGAIIVDKEVRKYFDLQIEKFDEDFLPDMSFLQSTLRKVPIQVLPIWYMVPRTSNNIFSSIVERYLLTPQVYERYLMELNFSDPTLMQIVDDIFEAKDRRVTAGYLKEKYELSEEQFQEYIIFLEFNLICCLSYRQENDRYIQVVSALEEWHQYLLFKNKTDPKSIDASEKIITKRKTYFYFIKDMTLILKAILHKPLDLLSSINERDYLLPDKTIHFLIENCEGITTENEDDVLAWQLYFSRVIEKICVIGLAHRHEEMLCPQRHAPDWLNMSLEDQALYLYRHPENRSLGLEYSQQIDSERNVREVEKSLENLKDKEWVYVDEFLHSVTSPIGGALPVTLSKKGGKWAYSLPTYSEEEKQFIHDVIVHRLAESGFVAIGTHQGRDCMMVTKFGKETLF